MVNGICFLYSLMPSKGGGVTEGSGKPPKISETTGCMTMKVLPDVKLNAEARKQN